MRFKGLLRGGFPDDDAVGIDGGARRGFDEGRSQRLPRIICVSDSYLSNEGVGHNIIDRLNYPRRFIRSEDSNLEWVSE